MYKKYEMELAGRTLRVDVGRVAKQANGAVLMHYGDTTVLCTATASEKPRDGIDFFPLSVEYNERMYAVGKIPGGFNKREGKASENAILDGFAVKDIMVYKARNLLYDPDHSTYEPAYKTQVTTYIERILRHATSDFKQDNIVQFFSNNPKSQKSLWLAKKDYVNAVLEEGDSLDYAIDETSGICDLTISFNGNARNLEVMINRRSSK